uniref:DnaD like replication protein n=1 Tax=Siphoviridae sp. ct7dP4 TaxID=2827787 RepID=A0A8S5TNL8_9CAUD|nr:MAG TPA: DnaD like replication protein [Siphoviridae sp. ct7dP4]
MSDNKKYYYLRVKENFYDSDEMIILESMPDGDENVGQQKILLPKS